METIKFDKGAKVKLPLNELGKITKVIALPWASKYKVRITKGGLFNTVGDTVDFLTNKVDSIN